MKRIAKDGIDEQEGKMHEGANKKSNKMTRIKDEEDYSNSIVEDWEGAESSYMVGDLREPSSAGEQSQIAMDERSLTLNVSLGDAIAIDGG